MLSGRSKATVASRQRTWLALTSNGRKALRKHLAALKALMAGAEKA